MGDLQYVLIAALPLVLLVSVVGYYFTKWQRSKGRG